MKKAQSKTVLMPSALKNYGSSLFHLGALEAKKIARRFISGAAVCANAA